MQFDFGKLGAQERYKLLGGVVVPRPIALVTTVSPDGVHNAAPFSFFNCMSYEPPVVVLGLDDRKTGGPKDTVHNIRAGGEFVVNLVDEPLAEAMNVCAVDFPPEVDELGEAGLSAVPSAAVRPPRIAESPVSLECREKFTIEMGASRHIILGEVVYLHVRDELIEPDTLRMRVERLRMVGRLFGSWYARMSDTFELPRMTYEQWRERKARG